MKEKLFANEISEEYLKWYYDTEVWEITSFYTSPIWTSEVDTVHNAADDARLQDAAAVLAKYKTSRATQLDAA